MVFTSATFLFYFLPIVLIGSFVIKKEYVNYFLLLMSIIFFSWNQINYLYIIVLNILITYLTTIFIEKYENDKKFFLVAGLTLIIIILIYFKYIDFIIDIINFSIGTKFDALNIILPIGISFFTFQSISYIIDVYRKETAAEKNILYLSSYIMLFPQLIAGPIVRYVDIKDKLLDRNVTIDKFEYGIKRFVVGLSKKVIIANVLGEIVDRIFADSATTYSPIIMIICIVSYMYQIYYDFSGYSDMAIGMGHMLGFTYKENFNYPYKSKSITEFWRRWHISLSSFFRDYVYIPLGGKYKHVYLNLLIVFLLTGIWHGASINFVIWGLWNAIFIILERIITHSMDENTLYKLNKNIFIKILKSIYTYIVILIGWVWFRCYDFDSAILFFKKLLAMMKPEHQVYSALWYLDNFVIFILVLAFVFSFGYHKKLIKIIKSHISAYQYQFLSNILHIILFLISIMFIYQDSYNPFIYFQF